VTENLGRNASGGGNVPEFPLDGDALALGIAGDPLAVATELRVVTGEKNQAGQNAGPELVEEGAVSVVPVDLPMRRDGSQIHDASVGTGRFVCGVEIGHG